MVFKKILKCVLSVLLVVTILLFVFVLWNVLNPALRFAWSKEYFTINNESYASGVNLFPPTVKAFEKIESGTSYEDIVKKFGYENGQLNSNGLKNGVFYITGKNEFVVLVFTDWLVADGENERRENGVYKILVADDEKIVRIILDDQEFYNHVIDMWNQYYENNS